MPWTTPGTAVAGDVLTAAFWNSNVRDNLNTLRALANVNQTALTNAFTQTITTTYADVTGFSVSITPTAATSKVMIFTYFTATPDAATMEFFFRLARNGTGIFVGDTASNRVRATGHNNDSGAASDSKISPIYLDSPATTSSVTYSVQARSNNGNATLYFNRTKTDTDSAGFGRSASSIIVMEIPA